MSAEFPGPKEAVYDNQIAPLMAQIIALCKEHKINMIADFCLGPEADADADGFGQDVFCTTSLPVDASDEAGVKRVNDVYRVLRPRSVFAAFTVITGGTK